MPTTTTRSSRCAHFTRRPSPQPLITRVVAVAAALMLAPAAITAQPVTTCVISTVDIDFDSGVDDLGRREGDLVFRGPAGFEVYFTDDDSIGSHNPTNGVRISNQGYGNIFVGSPTNLVLGANDVFASPTQNLHSSGIVARFNQGAQVVSFDDTDDDGTLKALFAFDAAGTLIGQSVFASQTTVEVQSVRDCGGQLIYSVEFDTLAGPAGGASDGTVFTIDNFHAAGLDSCTTVDRGWPTVSPTTPLPSAAPTTAPVTTVPTGPPTTSPSASPSPPPTCQTCVPASFCGDGTRLEDGVCVPDCAVLRRRDISCPYCDDSTSTSTDDGPSDDTAPMVVGVAVGVSLCIVLALAAFLGTRKSKNDDQVQEAKSKPRGMENPLYEAGAGTKTDGFGFAAAADSNDGYLDVGASK